MKYKCFLESETLHMIISFTLSHLLPKAELRIRIHLIRIRIQYFRLNTDPDPIRIQGF